MPTVVGKCWIILQGETHLTFQSIMEHQDAESREANGNRCREDCRRAGQAS